MLEDSTKVPTTIYHYCDMNAFLSIIQNKKLWLTSSESMNDSMEVQLFINNILAKAKRDSNNKIINLLNDKPKLPVYLCCFSKKPDLLSQWRAYGADGTGFSIGFDSKLLYQNKILDNNEIMIDSTSNELFLNNVEYGSVNSDFFYKTYEDTIDPNAKFTNDEKKMFYRIIDRNSCLEKSDYFDEEEESRLVYIPTTIKLYNTETSLIIDELNEYPNISNVKFRMSDSKIVPYFEYNLERKDEPSGETKLFSPRIKTPITKITLGPKCPMTIDEVRFFVEHLYYEEQTIEQPILISKSKGSYR